jgi:glucokinase
MLNYAVGLDLGGTNLKGGLVSEKGEILDLQSLPSRATEGPQMVLKNLISMARNLLERSQARKLPVTGIGIATPGIIDPHFGGLTGGADNLPGWRNTPFMKIMHKEFHVPVFAHNDVTATVLGEARHGAGIGKNNLVMATFGTGIGGGVIINGSLYGGATGYAGEIGHMPIRADGYTCACGIRGCWEEYASARGIIRLARKRLEQHAGKSLLDRHEKKSTIELTPQLVFESAYKGDKIALALVDEVGRDTAIGIGALINIFNPEVFVVGGGIAGAGNIYLNSILRNIPDWTLKDSLDAVEIVLTRLGKDAGIVGAATLVFDNVNRFEE